MLPYWLRVILGIWALGSWLVSLDIDFNRSGATMSKSSKRKAAFYVHSDTVQTSNQTFELSHNQRRVRIRTNTRVAEVVRPQPSSSTASAPQANTSSFADTSFDDSQFEGVVHQLDLSDSLHGVRVVAKEKAKRYENSVSNCWLSYTVHLSGVRTYRLRRS